ncbi:MAG: PPOX class F420-dependent oxidoreductase [Nocardioidaceae bacterium]|nr:PPOX class F420-dependent oxidoreductase [Nocardioidaceae bacterium]MCL2613835.1 PPOX class F420-dependent oxidoreductase [Nocardioidaceae bacterium]
MSFTDEEIAYIRSQRLMRVATVSDDGQPDVVPVGFELDGEQFYVGGYNPTNTRRARNVRAGNDRIAFVIDDMVSTDPWTPRSLRVYGDAALVERDGDEILRITPRISWSMNLDGAWSAGSGAAPPPRRTVH